MPQLTGSLNQHPGTSNPGSRQQLLKAAAQHGMLAAHPMQPLMRTTQGGTCRTGSATQGQQVVDSPAAGLPSSCHPTWMWPPSIGALGGQVSIAVPAASLSCAIMPLQKPPPALDAHDVQVSAAGLTESLSSSKILSLRLPLVETASEGSTEQQSSRSMSGLSPHAQDIFLGSPKRGLATSQPFKSKAVALPAASTVPIPSGGVEAPRYRTAAHCAALLSCWAGCSTDSPIITCPAAQHKLSLAATPAIVLLIAAFRCCSTC